MTPAEAAVAVDDLVNELLSGLVPVSDVRARINRIASTFETDLANWHNRYQETTGRLAS